jgi:hypothetical protein
MSVLDQNVLTEETAASAPDSSWSAARSALVATVLRGDGSLRQAVRMRVRGESMLPSLWPGDAVEIATCSLEDLRPGEIVLALRDGRFFLHRLVATQPNGFVLRGDSMPGPDRLFTVEALLGRQVRASAEGRTRMAFSRALGLLFCHCSAARRLALKLHRRRLTRQFLSLESAR